MISDIESIIWCIATLVFAVIFLGTLAEGDAKSSETPLETKKRREKEYSDANWDK